MSIIGWAYAEGVGKVDIEMKNTNVIDLQIIERMDICKIYSDEKAIKCGFKIILERTNKVVMLFKADNQCEIYNLNVQNFLKGNNVSRLKVIIRLVNLENAKKFLKNLKENGVSQSISKIRRKVKKANVDIGINYDEWFKKNKLTDEELEIQREYEFIYKPKISVIIPTYNTKVNFLKDVIESVRNQTYSNWELCIADGASIDEDTIKTLKEYEKIDKRIRVKYLKENYMISGNTNKALELVTGEYIALLDHDDLITDNALFEYVKVLNQDNTVDFMYSDEDKIDQDGKEFFDPSFKPDWSRDTFRSTNYICHFTIFSKKLLDEVGYFNHEFDGSQDYEMFLRLTEKCNKITHIPKILYHWRVHKDSTAGGMGAKDYCIDAGKRALTAHLERCGEEGIVKNGKFPGCYKIEYIIKEEKKVSIIIPNKDELDMLKVCIESIFNKTTYKNYEILIVENNSTSEEIFQYYKELTLKDNIKVITWEKEFNYSAINNYGVKSSNGEFIVLLNNDVEIISENWIEEMIMHAQRKEIGTVGAALYYKDDTIQHQGVLLGIGGVAEHLGKGLLRGEPGNMGRMFMILNVTAVTGACLMMRKELFNVLGGLNEDLGVAYNDVDLCLKAREKGYLNLVTPYAELYHYESKSRGLDISEEKINRLKKETEIFNSIWGVNKTDNYYNVNFSKQSGNFKLINN